MSASIATPNHLDATSRNGRTSDNFTPSESDNPLFFSSFFRAGHLVFCELSRGHKVLDYVISLALPFCRTIGAVRRALRALWTGDDPLNGRDAFRFVDSVIAYLNWRVTSSRQPGRSWRNQPDEVGNLYAAINILNQLVNSPGFGKTDEHKALYADLGRLLDEARMKSRPQLVRKAMARKAAA